VAVFLDGPQQEFGLLIGPVLLGIIGFLALLALQLLEDDISLLVRKFLLLVSITYWLRVFFRVFALLFFITVFMY